MPERRPVIMIGIDAADRGLVRRLMAEGRMPVLAGLEKRGQSGGLATVAGAYAGGVWPSFYTGRPVERHGIYHNKLWRARAMRIEVPSEAWLPDRPFYERVAAAGLRVAAIDMPMVVGEPRVGAEGIYLGGWGTHDLISRAASPPGLWRDLKRRHGPPAMEVEQFGLQDAGGLDRLRGQLLRATDQMAAIAADLLKDRRFDLACLVFGASHRGGHYLWDLSQVDTRSLDDDARARLEGALAEIYQRIDQAIGQVLEAADPAARVMVFALHGMEKNHGMADHFPDLMAAMDAAESGKTAKRGLLYRIKRRIPFHWIRPVLARLPAEVGHRLASIWSARMLDWRATTHFPMPVDLAGYVRINLQGRERDGIVPPGDAYEELCARLEERLSGLRDADTGRSLVAAVERPWSRTPGPAEQRDLLPDLLVRWSPAGAEPVRRIACDVLPGFVHDLPKHFPSGRAGNHRAEAWFVAAGPGIEAGSGPEGGSIVDLAPTALALLGLPPDPSMSGRALALHGSELAA
ncbi:alkaline phosphatase family protein [Geminicoccus roseus]|uniref:alkaline phosphatase family protein n=1 Tax=Geminicoccus roseus TaxID=404900 RepID=UPI0003FEF0D7|nr:alkaline phosphatase family protein [Geminicoccus roseus]